MQVVGLGQTANRSKGPSHPADGVPLRELGLID